MNVAAARCHGDGPLDETGTKHTGTLGGRTCTLRKVQNKLRGKLSFNSSMLPKKLVMRENWCISTCKCLHVLKEICKKYVINTH